MKLDIGRCFEEAWDVFLKNWLILLVGAAYRQFMTAQFPVEGIVQEGV